jgi:hypothetical protein
MFLLPFRRRADCTGDARMPATLSDIRVSQTVDKADCSDQIQMLF